MQSLFLRLSCFTLSFLAAIVMAINSANAQAKTKAAITSEIDSLFADNTSGQITPAKLRQVTKDIVNSYGGLIDINSYSQLNQFWMNAAVAPSPLTGTIIQLGNVDATATRLELNSFGASSFFTSACYGGTNASKTALAQDTQCGGLNFYGYDGTSLGGPAATFRTFAAQNWAPSAHGSYAEVATTTNNSTSLTTRMRWENDGGITVPPAVTGGSQGAGTINASNLFINGVQVTAGGSVPGSNTQVIFNNSGALGASPNLTWVSPKLSVGVAGSTTGQLALTGSTSGTATIQPQATAGTPTITLPNTSGTVATTAASPLSLNATTGQLTTTTGTLSKTDDTNVTMTLGGTPTNALFNSVSMTLGWTGTLSAARGGFGTNVSSSSGVPLFATGTPTFTSTTGTGNFVRATSPSVSGLTVTGSFTATGLVGNSSLTNPSTTVNGQTCTLGSTCTVTAAATGVTVGTTTVASGTNGFILYNNSGVLGNSTLTSLMDTSFGSTQGNVLYRGASGWTSIGPGTSGQVLTTGGPAADPTWTSVAGTGTVTQVNTGTGLTGGPLTTTGTIDVTGVLADLVGQSWAQGDVIYYNGTNLVRLAPGSNGQLLQTQGPSANPQWATVSGSGTVTSVSAGTGMSFSTITSSGSVAIDKASASNFRAGTADKVLTADTVFTSEVTVTYGTTTSFDFSTFINASVTLTGDITTMNTSNIKAGQAGTIAFIQDGSGNHTAVWNSNFKFAGGTTPTLSTAANAVDILTYACRTTSFCTAILVKDVK